MTCNYDCAGCEWCKSSKPLLYPKDKFCRYCGRQLNKTDKGGEED